MTSINNQPPSLPNGGQGAGKSKTANQPASPTNENPQANKAEAHQGDIRDNHHHPNQNALDNKQSDLNWCYYPVPGLHKGNERNLLRPHLVQHPTQPDHDKFHHNHDHGDCGDSHSSPPPPSDPPPSYDEDQDLDPDYIQEPDPFYGNRNEDLRH